MSKYRMPNKREIDTRQQATEYTAWTRAVKKRDGNKCQMPGCNKTHKLQVHHIQMWSNSIYLRYVVANGITLCIDCHKSIRGKEQHWMMTFSRIVQENTLKDQDNHKLRKLNNEEIAFIKQNYNKMRSQELATYLKVCKTTVDSYIKKLGLKDD